MSIVVFLNKMDVVGILLMLFIAGWVALSAGHGVLNRNRSRSICLLLGSSLLLLTQAATLGAGIMRRIVWHTKGSIWPPLESWGFGLVKVLTFIGIMLVFRALTVEAWGARPTNILLAIMIVGFVWAILPWGTPSVLNVHPLP